MAKDIVEKLRVEGDSSDAQRAAKGAEKSLTGAFFKAQIAAQAATKAFAFATAQLKAGVDAALENERTTLKLETALRLQSREVATNTAALGAQASAIEAVSGISDEVIRKFQGQAINLGVATDEVDKFVRASIALANATNKDVNTAFEQLTQSMSGLLPRTLKVIPAFRELSKEELQAGKAADILVEQFGDLVGLETQGASGQITQMTNAVANLAEELGKLVTNVGESSGLFRDVADGAQFLADMIAAVDLPEDLANEPQIVGLGGGAGGRSRRGSAGGGPVGGIELEAVPENFITLAGEVGGPAGIDLQAQAIADREERGRQMIDLIRSQLDERAEVERAAADEREAIARESEQRKFEVTRTFATATADFAMQLFAQILEGEKINGALLVTETLKNLGSRIFGQGLYDIAIGTSRFLTGDPLGAAQVNHGLTEVAVGGTMAASGAIVGNAFGVGGGGGGGGGRATSTADSSPAFGRTGETTGAARGGEPLQVTIVFNGPTTAASVGVAINDALGAARDEGLI